MAAKPITPNEVANIKKSQIPDEAIDSFNELIAENFLNGYSLFTQKKVVARMVKKGLKEKDIFANGWLDLEDIFRKAGWKVVYDGPAFNETYEATFSFSKKNSS